MNELCTQRRTTSAVRLIFALASVWSLSASWAEASCGDYVMFAHAGGRAVQPVAAPRENPSPPCRGPLCRQSPAAPLPADVPLRIAAFDVWAGLMLPVGEANRSSAAFDQAALGLPSAETPRIDRPPKAGL